MSEFNYDPVAAVLSHVAIEERQQKRIEELENALRELCLWNRIDGDCWCDSPGAHSPGCMAARRAMAKAANTGIDDAAGQAKVYTVNCEVGPTVEEAVAQMQMEGYTFAQLEMPNGTYGWLIGRKARR